MSNRCRLVVLALEVGGRWSEEAASFIRLLARSDSREAAPALRAALVARCSALLSFAAQLSFAESLLEGRGQSNFGGLCPDWKALLADSACSPSTGSRVPR